MADFLRVEHLSKRFGGNVSGQRGSDAGRVHFAGSDITAVPMHALADRITVLVYGRVITSGKPEEIRSNAQVCDVYLGEQEAIYG